MSDKIEVDIAKKLGKIKIVPVIKINQSEKAIPLADALVAGGIPCIEITMRTGAAAEAMRLLRDRTDILVGAGTVLTVDQAKQALDAGVKFIVTPGIGPKVIEFCLNNNLPIFPGVSSATDIQTAIDLGLSYLKFFPAEASGGLPLLKALSAPFDSIQFIPTGGIGLNNVRDYLSHPCVLACGGSWLATATAIDNNKFAEIEKECLETSKLLQSF